MRLGNLGEIEKEEGHYLKAIERNRQVLEIFRDAGAELYQGEVYSLLGQHAEAVDRYEWALDIARRIGDHAKERRTVNNLGRTYRLMGRHDAVEQHNRAIELAVTATDRYEQARALDGIGWVRQDIGDPAQARRWWGEALALYSELGVPEAEQVRARLADMAAAC